ncbi:uncharacterized protein LOC143446258 isoform X2 [Clavelina lepadiformis]|uniref:uncharacterized protein LOC143446258 isoform X2 n=1 Tax=Clavelina lepadiformis TaxID=159417 RepID=UPI0040432AEB
MEVNLISLFLLVLSWNVYFCHAQTFSSLTPSNAIQAIGSDVEITTNVTTSPPFTATWRIDGIVVGTASVNSAGTATAGAVTTGTIYESRVDISAGSFTSNQYTTVLTIQALLASEDGVTVDVGTPGIYDTSLNLNVQECSLDTTANPNLTFTCNDSPCAFNSAGTLSCAEGYETSGVSTTSTTCQADAMLTNLDVLSCAAIATTAPSTTAEASTASTTDSSTDNNGSTSTTGSQTETSTTMGNDSNTDPSSRVASSETCLNGGEIAAIVICSLICVGCMVGFPVAFVVGSLTSSTVAIVGSTVGFLSGFVLVITFSALYDTNYICNDGFTEVISYLEVGGAIAMGVILAALTLAAFITEVLLYLGAGCFAGKVNRTETDSNVNRADTNLHVEQRGIEGKETTNSSYILSNNAKPPPYKKSHLAPLHNPPKPPRQPLEKGTPRPLPVPPKTSDPNTKSKEPLKKSSKNQITPRHDPTFNGDSNQVSNSKANNKSKRNYEDSKTDPV